MSNIKIFGVPRSGSTVIFNIINYLFEGRLDPQVHYYFADEEGGDLKTVVTYRDFRDSCISQWRAFYGGFDEEEGRKDISLPMLKKHVHDQLNTVEALNRFKKDYDQNNRQVLFLRYEKFFDSRENDLNFDYLFQELESYFKTEISETQRTYIRREYCFINQKNKTKIFKNFHEYDEITHLHGHHLYKGKTGSWREMVPRQHHTAVNETLKESLLQWGYEI
jgi:hypothetical protein